MDGCRRCSLIVIMIMIEVMAADDEGGGNNDSHNNCITLSNLCLCVKISMLFSLPIIKDRLCNEICPRNDPL